jgi:outer membrane protein TolC
MSKKNSRHFAWLLVFAIAASAKGTGQELPQSAQELTLEQVQEQAAANYPLIRQRDLIRKTSGLTIENLRTSFLPQANISAQATYQSAVTEIPVKVPAFAVEPLSKDQYRALLDVNQLIYDGGSYTGQRRLQEWNEKAEQEKIAVELQKLRETINQVFFSALLAAEQKKLVLLVDNDLEAGIRRVEAQVANGTAFRSALASLQAEKLRNGQRAVEWESNRRGLLDVLGLYMGTDIPDEVLLMWPEVGREPLTDSITRSELRLLRFQDSALMQRDELVDVRNRPKLSAFGQAGYGRPGLNMLENRFAPFFLGGVRVNWALNSLYTSKRDREILGVQRQVLSVQEDQFLLQTRARLKQQRAEVRKWESLLETDAEIIVLKDQVRDATKAQLDQGVATASDYIREVNAAGQARLQELLHRLQWMQATIQYRTIAGQENPTN